MPPVSLPPDTVSVVAQPPLVAVLPTQTVLLLLHTLLVPVGPVLGVIAWLKVRMILSPVSSVPSRPPLTN